MGTTVRDVCDLIARISNTWNWNVANFVVAGLAAVFAGAGLWWVWPRRAMPGIVDIRLYDGGGGHAANFPFLCHFVVRNDGDHACELEKVEILLENTTFQYARSVCQGRTVFNGPPAPMVTASTLPLYIGKNAQQEVIIIGKGSNDNPRSPDLPKEIPVKITFVEKRKKSLLRRKLWSQGIA